MCENEKEKKYQPIHVYYYYLVIQRRKKELDSPIGINNVEKNASKYFLKISMAVVLKFVFAKMLSMTLFLRHNSLDNLTLSRSDGEDILCVCKGASFHRQMFYGEIPFARVKYECKQPIPVNNDCVIFVLFVFIIHSHYSRWCRLFMFTKEINSRCSHSKGSFSPAKRLLCIHWISSFHLFKRCTFTTLFCIAFRTHFVLRAMIECSMCVRRVDSSVIHPHHGRFHLLRQWCVLWCEFKRAIKVKPSKKTRTTDFSQFHDTSTRMKPNTPSIIAHIKQIVDYKIKYLISSAFYPQFMHILHYFFFSESFVISKFLSFQISYYFEISDSFLEKSIV